MTSFASNTGVRDAGGVWTDDQAHYEELRDRYVPDAPMWITETANDTTDLAIYAQCTPRSTKRVSPTRW